MKNTNKSINRKQNLQIAALQRKVAQLKSASRPKPRRPSARPSVSGRNTGTSIKADPVLLSARAKLNPFDCPKGLASTLENARPSQKFMARSTGTITIPAGCTAVFMHSPCIASDTNRASLVVAIQSAVGTPLSQPWRNTLVGDLVIGGGTLQTFGTNTPYTASTLTDAVGGYEWALVGSGIRFTYEGATLYQSGICKYMYDKERRYNGNSPADWGTRGPADVITFLDSSTNAIVNSVTVKKSIEINALCDENWQEQSNLCPRSGQVVIGGISGSNYFAVVPGIVGYITNSSTATVSYRVDQIEHWNVSAPAIQALHTDSIAHPVLSSQIYNLIGSSRQNMAQKPHQDHTSVLKFTQKAMGSPIGHEVLNAAVAAALA